MEKNFYESPFMIITKLQLQLSILGLSSDLNGVIEGQDVTTISVDNDWESY